MNSLNSKALDSVIEITKQRDVDSLDSSFITVLADLVPSQTISIYKLVNDKDQSSIEETLRLDILVNKKGEVNHAWSTAPRFISCDEYIEQCLKSAEVVRVESGSKSVSLIFPVVCANRTLGAVGISGSLELEIHMELLEKIISVYSNYLHVLNESERDKLTDLFNRRTFDKKLERLLGMQKKLQFQNIHSSSAHEHRKLAVGANAWLVVLDIDHFKRVNDQYGHVCGDEVILLLAQNMQQCFRNTDLLFRFGGEEFVVILEPIPSEMAQRTLERFRIGVESQDFPLVGSVTVSIGYAKITASDYPPVVLENADKALYYSKDNGRNQVSSYESLLHAGVLRESQNSGSVDLF